MNRRLLLAILVIFFSFSTFANPVTTSSPNKIKRVIYITLDGTRWQDLYETRNVFKKFWNKYANQAKLYGFPGTNTTMEVASIPVSLPSYHSQMTGEVQPCDGNDCGRMQAETIPEMLVHQYGMNKNEVAIIASWRSIEEAAEHVPGTVFTNVGNDPLYDPVTHVADNVMYGFNLLQSVHKQENRVRHDLYTFGQAYHFYNKYQPKFMWLSLNDADEAAHGGHTIMYYLALAFYDDSIDRLLTSLKNMNIDKETMVIITTDHGRGNGDNWKHHGGGYPESKRTWAIVINGELEPVSVDNGIYHYSTLSIKPTVERVFRS